MILFAGVDYGSKKAGTTVISWKSPDGMVVMQSEKNKDADNWLLDIVLEKKIKNLFIDAPLSLPKAFYNPAANADFFYRECDRSTNAMSPMFLGGLTARAIALSNKLKDCQVNTIEVYPAQLRRLLGDEWMSLLTAYTGLNNEFILTSNNHVRDSLLAWLSGYRFNQNTHSMYGISDEGVIVV